jgi:uracil-DNA glycosylase
MQNSIEKIPEGWARVLADEVEKPHFAELQSFLKSERARGEVCPAACDVYSALRLTPFENVKVVLMGQDPYHGAGQAHGLAFSVRAGVKPPPSLVNMFKELKSDLGIDRRSNGCLEGWARQGVLLLNAVLTVRGGEANSHKSRGWEKFTDAIIAQVNARSDPSVFVLWGANAQKKKCLIDPNRHVIIESVHPSPLSAHNGFFGSRPFSKINAALRAFGKTEIDWYET